MLAHPGRDFQGGQLATPELVRMGGQDGESSAAAKGVHHEEEELLQLKQVPSCVRGARLSVCAAKSDAKRTALAPARESMRARERRARSHGGRDGTSQTECIPTDEDCF